MSGESDSEFAENPKALTCLENCEVSLECCCAIGLSNAELISGVVPSDGPRADEAAADVAVGASLVVPVVGLLEKNERCAERDLPQPGCIDTLPHQLRRRPPRFPRTCA